MESQWVDIGSALWCWFSPRILRTEGGGRCQWPVEMIFMWCVKKHCDVRTIHWPLKSALNNLRQWGRITGPQITIKCRSGCTVPYMPFSIWRYGSHKNESFCHHLFTLLLFQTCMTFSFSSVKTGLKRSFVKCPWCSFLYNHNEWWPGLCALYNWIENTSQLPM